MPVPNDDFQTTYTTDGVTTQYAFAWACVDIASVEVFLDGTQIFTGFTAALNPVTIGGYINFSPVQAGGQTLLIQRVSDTLQNNDFGNNEAIPPVTLVQMFDKLTIICQQLTAQIALSLALSLPDAASGVSGTLPTPIIPGALIGWDAAGTAPYYAVPVEAGWVLTDNGPGQQFSSQPAPGGGGGGGNLVGVSPPASVVGALPFYIGTDGRLLSGMINPNTAGFSLVDNGVGFAPSYQAPHNAVQHTTETVPASLPIALTNAPATVIGPVSPNLAGTYLVLCESTVTLPPGASGNPINVNVISGGTGGVTIANNITGQVISPGGDYQYTFTAIGVAVLAIAASSLEVQAVLNSAGTASYIAGKLILVKIG